MIIQHVTVLKKLVYARSDLIESMLEIEYQLKT